MLKTEIKISLFYYYLVEIWLRVKVEVCGLLPYSNWPVFSTKMVKIGVFPKKSGWSNRSPLFSAEFVGEEGLLSVYP